MFSNKINPQVNNIYDSLRLKEDKSFLSAKTVNKLLQILYDDLKDAANIVFTSSTRRRFDNPAAHLTRDLAVRFIHDVARNSSYSNNDRLANARLPPEEICGIEGFEVCRLLIEKMYTKIFLWEQLYKAMLALRGSSYLQTDPNRKELLEFITHSWDQLNTHSLRITCATQLKMQQMGLIDVDISCTNFRDVVMRSFAVAVVNNKSRLNMRHIDISMKRRVDNIEPLSTRQLKTNIQEILFAMGPPHEPFRPTGLRISVTSLATEHVHSRRESLSSFSALNSEDRPAPVEISYATDEQIKAMACWEKLKHLAVKYSDQYQPGGKVTLYYTGVNNDFDWYTKEECLQNNYNQTEPTEKEIPTEEQYRIGVDLLREQYDAHRVEMTDWFMPFE
ncbi:hypothetical protein [Enterobacter sp. Bisph1]|uniref:hypothetical protein n=1 Tax=Enterobacter sp. Bisph1 TaxID=1274399 RepID=UPI00057C278D|nr:hypothetical protein [Enterobacter sp. Bisph1]